MSRQRRRRVQDEGEVKEEKQSHSSGKSQVVFMEEMDYKMEIEDNTEEKKQVILKKEQFSE